MEIPAFIKTLTGGKLQKTLVSDTDPLPVKGSVSLSGAILAEDPATGNLVPLTAVQDSNGHWVLRMADAAPWGWDAVASAVRVLPVGGMVKLASLLYGAGDITIPASGSVSLYTASDDYQKIRVVYRLAASGTVDVRINHQGDDGVNMLTELVTCSSVLYKGAEFSRYSRRYLIEIANNTGSPQVLKSFTVSGVR